MPVLCEKCGNEADVSPLDPLCAICGDLDIWEPTNISPLEWETPEYVD